jgi:hypothetical protein
LRSDSPTNGASSRPASRARSGRPQVAAALDAQEQDALGRVERLRPGPAVRQEPDPPRRDPLLELLEPAELVEPLRCGDELEEAAALDQHLLRLADPGPVRGGQPVVLDDRPREGALRLEHRQALQVRDDPLDVVASERDTGARVLAGEPLHHAAQEVAELVGAGKGEVEPDGDVLELGLRRDGRRDEHDRAGGARELLRGLPEHPERRRLLQLSDRVLEEPGPVAGGRADRPQREPEVDRLLGIGGMRGQQATCRAPGPERERELARDGAHERLEALLLHGLADHQRVAGPEQEGEVASRDVQVPIS